eukprot:1157330-Pelagomonas_calceolata.AAC.2
MIKILYGMSVLSLATTEVVPKQKGAWARPYAVFKYQWQVSHEGKGVPSPLTEWLIGPLRLHSGSRSGCARILSHALLGLQRALVTLTVSMGLKKLPARAPLALTTQKPSPPLCLGSLDLRPKFLAAAYKEAHSNLILGQGFMLSGLR